MREPDPTHNELKHTTTVPHAKQPNAPQTNLTFTRKTLTKDQPRMAAAVQW